MLQLLYERFLIRDIIGKLTPGFIVLLTFYYSLNDSIFHISLKDPNFKIAVWLIFPISYLIGIILQIVGELIGLHWTCRAPKFILLFPTGGIGYFKKYHEELLNNVRDLSLMAGDTVRILDERNIALKEGAGNFSLALLVLIVAGFISPNLDTSRYAIPLTILCVSGFVSHYVLMRRQIAYESKIIEELKFKK